ncbi:MAG: tyrosinase family protein [Desulfobacterales bacterium]|jgi:tyrosinase
MITRRQALKTISATLVAPYLLSKPKSLLAQTARVRRDLTRMADDDPFFAKYAGAIQMMHDLPESDPRSWRNQAIIHADHCPHGMPDFLQWHRFYITYFETICGEMIGDSNFALPYWNWSNNNGTVPLPFFGSNPLNVAFTNDPSDYQPPAQSRTNWGPDPIATIGSRMLSPTFGLGTDPRFSRVFESAEIEGIMRLSDFNQFFNSLEGSPHNIGHVITGNPNGHMASGLSPLDPLFWLHHCNVDRIWAEWQAAGNMTPSDPMQYAGQFVDAAGEPVDAGADQSHDHLAMGFTYDSITAPISPLLNRLDLPKTALPDMDAGDQIVSLGTVENEESSTVDEATELRVATPELSQALFGKRVFRATKMLTRPRNAMEPSRILALLEGVSYPKAGDERIVVNVFVNCPYLSPLTPSSDPHYAGAFAFFGQPMKDMKNGGRFAIDVTSPLRDLAAQGRLDPQGLNVQLMPLTITDEGPKGAKFKVSAVEVLKV